MKKPLFSGLGEVPITELPIYHSHQIKSDALHHTIQGSHLDKIPCIYERGGFALT